MLAYDAPVMSNMLTRRPRGFSSGSHSATCNTLNYCGGGHSINCKHTLLLLYSAQQRYWHALLPLVLSCVKLGCL
jgi:hypothetical protein